MKPVRYSTWLATQRGRRGPEQQPRCTSAAAAVLTWAAATDSTATTKASKLLAVSAEQVQHVLDGRRGVPAGQANLFVRGLRRLLPLPVRHDPAPRSDLPPRFNALIDGITLRAKLDPDRRDAFRNLLLPASGFAGKEMHNRYEVILDADGTERRLWLVRSSMDVVPFKRRQRKWDGNVEIRDTNGDALAIVSVVPPRKRCPTHRHRAEPCPACEQSKYGECLTCWQKRWCSECEKLTDAQPNYEMEVYGQAFERGLAASLLSAFFHPFVHPSSVRPRTWEVALDVELPLVELVVAQSDARWAMTALRAYWMGQTTGWSFGDESTRLVRVYDKMRETFLPGRPRKSLVPRLPEHVRGWLHVTRFESVEHESDGETPTPEAMVSQSIATLAKFVVADVRDAEPGTPEEFLLRRAQFYGFVPAAPSETRVEAAVGARAARFVEEVARPGERTERWTRAMPNGGDGLGLTDRVLHDVLHGPGRRRRNALAHARSVAERARSTVRAEIDRLAPRAGIDLEAMLDVHRARLTVELRALLVAGATASAAATGAVQPLPRAASADE